MKNFRIIILASLIACLSAFNLNAQSQKVGYIDIQELNKIMPEIQVANAELDKYITQLDNQAKTMAEEYKKFITDLEPQLETMNEMIRETKIKEAQDKERRIQEFQYDAQQKVQQREAELMEPIQKKALDAINAVADRQGFTYIVNSALLIYKGSGSIDILPMVRAQLGI